MDCQAKESDGGRPKHINCLVFSFRFEDQPLYWVLDHFKKQCHERKAHGIDGPFGGTGHESKERNRMACLQHRQKQNYRKEKESDGS